jgi:hypothetical protein
MIEITSQIVRRGFQAYTSTGDGGKVEYQLPTWVALILASTVLVFFFATFMIEYTFGRVIPTLLMIESPTEVLTFEPLATEDPDSSVKGAEPNLKPQPITASFRKSVRLLQNVGGFRGRFRGFAVWLAKSFAINTISGMISFMLPRSLGNIVAIVACAQLSLAWTHIVISEPSPKPWYRRLPPAKTWRVVAVPSAILAVCDQVAIFVPVYIAMATGMTDNPANMTPHQKSMLPVKGLALALLGLVLALVLVIPAKATLIRVQASLLPDSEETIVPFDRSFGGKVVPEIVGGNGISMRDAWTTFDWASRVRLVKAYAKVFAMQLALAIVFTLCLVAQLLIFVGKDFSKLIPDTGEKPN